MSNEALDPIARLLAERACERLINEFVRRLDLGDPGSVGRPQAVGASGAMGVVGGRTVIARSVPGGRCGPLDPPIANTVVGAGTSVRKRGP
ncbi:hypothetical protein [Streptomyces celluloflavus]|uniref:hypothetical protein n=1 Tax=Streptomyces celluloflavus TaxID=58344 RepID=UPI0036AC4C91